MPIHSHFQTVLDHYERALTFCPQPSKIQERIAGLHWTFMDISQAMEHYLQACTLNPQAHKGFWHLYFYLQYLAGLESPRLLEFCQRIVDLVEPNTHHYHDRGFPALLLATAYYHLGKREYARNVLQQAYRTILTPNYPKLIESAWTERCNRPPNFLIIGVWKCGTSSLYYYLGKHPKILPALTKELHYFTSITHWQKEETFTDYLDYFPPIDNPAYQTGEATPAYIIQPNLARYLRQYFPEVKIIILLRNPVKRAISHFYMRERNCDPIFSQTLDGLTHIDLAKVDSIIKQTYTTLRAEISWRQRLTRQEEVYPCQADISSKLAHYLALSHYIRYLPQWFEHFPKEQILVIRSEDLFEKASDTMKQVYTFLGLEYYPLLKYPKVNSLPYNTISPELFQQLTGFFKPYNEELEDYLGRKLNW